MLNFLKIGRRSGSIVRKLKWTRVKVHQGWANTPISSFGTSVTSEVPPTPRQLRILALRAAIPMVGFGFMDNLVMIEAGDMIDLTLGVTFALSTLTAAGLGQCFSDVAGVTCGGIVDAAVGKLNLPEHGLSASQLKMRPSRITYTAGSCIGVVCGCLLGMSTLLVKDTEKAERLRRAKELDSIFRAVMDDASVIILAQRSTLWLVDKDPNTHKLEMWTRFASHQKEIIRIGNETSSVPGTCVLTGNTIIIPDAYEDDRFNPSVDKKTGFRTRSIIAVPVINPCSGEILGAIEFLNKVNEDGTDGVFDQSDAKLIKMLSCHVSQFIRMINGCS